MVGRVLIGEWWRSDLPGGGLVLNTRKFYNYKMGASKVFRLNLSS